MNRHWLRFTLVAAIALFCPVLLHAAGTDRDTLLALDGTLYTVESVPPEALPDVQPSSLRALVLTVQHDNESTSIPVPATLSVGYNLDPALGYDETSNTLFIFWETLNSSGFTSDLSFCSYRDGTWGTPATLDSVDYNFRRNLRIGITRKTEQQDANGNVSSFPEVTVHAVWWEESGNGDRARYAMLTTDNGNITSIRVQNLSDFIYNPEPLLAAPVDNELLRHPVVLESTAHDTVDVVFGDVRRGTMHRITLKPVANGRLRIPIGVRDGAIPTPVAVVDSADGFSALSSADGSLAYYFNGPNTVRYLLYKDGAWSPLRSIALSEKLSLEGAVDAMRRMMSSE